MENKLNGVFVNKNHLRMKGNYEKLINDKETMLEIADWLDDCQMNGRAEELLEKWNEWKIKEIVINNKIRKSV